MTTKPTKLDQKLQDGIAILIRNGVTVEVAAQATGISESTFYAWMERGEQAQSGAFREFYEAIEQARGQSESLQVVRVSQAAQRGSWQAAAWLLERRHPERWAKPTGRKQKSGDNDDSASENPFDQLDELTPRRQARQNGS